MKIFGSFKSMTGTLAALLLLGSTSLSAATIPWLGGTAGADSMATTTNWTGSVLPTLADTAQTTSVGAALNLNDNTSFNGTAPKGIGLIQFNGTNDINLTGTSGTPAVLIIGTGGTGGAQNTTAVARNFFLAGYSTITNAGSANGAAITGTAAVNYVLTVGHNSLTFAQGQAGGTAVANVSMAGGNNSLSLAAATASLTLNDISSNASSDSIVLPTTAGYTLTFGSSNSTTIDGVISGGNSTGGIVKQGGGKVTLAGANTFSGSIVVTGGGTLQGTNSATSIPDLAATLSTTGSTLEFSQDLAITRTSSTTGAGRVFVDSGTALTYTSLANNYTGGTFVSGGSTLTGNGNNFPQDAVTGINLAAAADTLDFAQTSNNTYGGLISGSGVVELTGSGTNTLYLTANSGAFAGTTNIAVGNLNLQDATSALGGNFNVSGTGILSGIGSVGTGGGSPSTTTVTGGTVSPGNGAPGILTNLGNYSQTGGTLQTFIKGQNNIPGTNNGELIVDGTMTVASPATITVNTQDGGFYIGGNYTIAHSVGTLSGTYSPIVVTNTSIAPDVIYDYVGNNILLDFTTPFIGCANDENGVNVALQLASITAPTDPAIIELLTQITSLSCPEIGVALDDLSGSQYADFLLGAELSTHQFVRRLYDPLRTFLAKDLCCCECDCCCDDGIKVWLEGGGLQSEFKGNKKHHHGDVTVGDSGGYYGHDRHHGFKSSGYQITGGAQMESCDNTWVAGAAITYEHTTNKFHLGGHADTNTVIGGLYGAYRMCDFYVLGDLVFGGSQAKLHREFFIGIDEYYTHSKPELLQGILYAEFGKNFRFNSFLIAPFLGLEGGYFSWQHKKDHDFFDPIALNIKNRNYGTFDTRLGVHLAMDEVACGLFIGVDLAWQYRCTELNNNLDIAFENFGDYYHVRGVHLDPNSFEAALNLEQKIGDCWSIYATGFWQQWSSNSYAYDILGGVTFKF